MRERITLSDQASKKLEREANRSGLTKSQYVEQLILGYKPKVKPSAEFYKDMRKVYAFANALEAVNGYHPPAEYRQMASEWREFMAKIQERYISNGSDEDMGGKDES